MTASAGRFGRPAPTSAAVAVDRVLQRLGVDRRARRQRERQLRRSSSPSLGWRSPDQHLGGRVGVVAVDHRRRRRTPRRSGSSASPAGAGRVVQRVHRSCRARPLASSPVSRTCRCGFVPCGGWCQSVTTSACSATKTPPSSAHSSTGLLTRSKCAHQNGLSSRWWIAPGRRDHRDGGLLGGARLDAVAGERHQRAVEVVGDLDGVPAAVVAHRLRAARRHLRFDGAGHQPVAEPARRPAVVAVVVLDLLEHDLRLVGPAVVAQLAVAGVLRDRVGRRGHLAAAQLVAHVERLEVLDAVALGADANALAHQRIQVDEHAVAEQVVDVVLADAVAARPAAAACSSRTPRSGRRACRGSA